MENINNIMQLCRLCLVKDQVNVPIFGGTNDLEGISSKISSCLPVKVAPDDSLPKKICDDCSYKLDLLYVFRNTSISSEKQLYQWLEQAGISKTTSGTISTAQSLTAPISTDPPFPSVPISTLDTVMNDTITKSEISVKQEKADSTAGSELSAEAQEYLLQQQKLPYQENFGDFNTTGTNSAAADTEEPVRKKPRRAAASKSPIKDNDSDTDMPPTKAEDDSDEDIDDPGDGGMDDDDDDDEEEEDDGLDNPEFVDVPSTSAEEQPGPSGVNKDPIAAPENEAPSDIEEETETSTKLDLIPPKSKEKYEMAYRRFLAYRLQNDIKVCTETVMIRYFKDLSTKIKSSTLWSVYSMLRATLNQKEKIDISKFQKMRAFLKRQSQGYKAKKCRLLTKDQVQRFIFDAPDDKYLMIKVALIFGISGSCRRNELAQMHVNDIEDMGFKLLIKIKDNRTNEPRYFVVSDTYLDVYRKYVACRPKNFENSRFFFKYANGVGAKQVVGINTFGKIPQIVANYLRLPNAKEYTGHCFRLSGKVLGKVGIFL